jgi:hypothetical protein
MNFWWHLMAALLIAMAAIKTLCGDAEALGFLLTIAVIGFVAGILVFVQANL